MLPPADAVIEAGTMVGRYRVGDLLGEGGMGRVYEAIQVGLDRQVALKVLKPKDDRADGDRARFEREARVAAALRHPGAVEVYDFGEDDGRLYLAMERLRGPTLRHVLGRGALRADALVEVALQIADVLVAAHGMALVHRDLKPGNVFLEPTQGGERVVVADFGLAFISGRPGAERITREGVMTGTPAYVSPEQALGRAVGPESDIYSFGCTLYEMASGQPPFREASDLAVLTQHLFAAPAPLRSLRASREVPHALEALVSRMLAKHPEERPSAGAVAVELEALRGRAGASERGRGEQALLSRVDRAVPERDALRAAKTLSNEGLADTGPAARVLVVGQASPELVAGLRANGLDPVLLGDDRGLEASAFDVVFAPGASIDRLAELKRIGLPLLTDALPSDIKRIAALVGVGVDEAVPGPARPHELARRIRRAIARARRCGEPA